MIKYLDRQSGIFLVRKTHPTIELNALKDRDMKSGFDFIDFWAVDFDWHKGKSFEHNWQDFRTCKDRTLKTVSDFGYDRYPKKANILPVSRQLMFSDGGS